MSAPIFPTAMDKDTPQRLAVVAAQFGLTAGALRTEAKRGRLVISRVAGRDWTSVAEVQGMFGLCRVTPEAPTYGSGQPVGEVRAPSAQSGSLRTPDVSIALASAWTAVQRLKGCSPTTSPVNTHRLAATAT